MDNPYPQYRCKECSLMRINHEGGTCEECLYWMNCPQVKKDVDTSWCYLHNTQRANCGCPAKGLPYYLSLQHP